MKELRRLLAVCALLALLLTGCSVPLPENRQVEDLLRAPRSSSRFSFRNWGRTKSESNLCCAADRRTA